MDQRQKFPTKSWISHSYIPVGRNATRREAPPSWRKQTQIRPVHGDRLTAPGTIASNTATPHGAMSSAHPQIEWKLATWRTTTRGLPYLPRPCRTGPGKSYGSRRRARGGRSPLLSSPLLAPARTSAKAWHASSWPGDKNAPPQRALGVGARSPTNHFAGAVACRSSCASTLPHVSRAPPRHDVTSRHAHVPPSRRRRRNPLWRARAGADILSAQLGPASLPSSSRRAVNPPHPHSALAPPRK